MDSPLRILLAGLALLLLGGGGVYLLLLAAERACGWLARQAAAEPRGGPVPGEAHTLAPAGSIPAPATAATIMRATRTPAPTTASTTTPASRLQRLLGEGARLVAMGPGHTSIDVTPDVLSLVEGVQNTGRGF